MLATLGGASQRETNSGHGRRKGWEKLSCGIREEEVWDGREGCQTSRGSGRGAGQAYPRVLQGGRGSCLRGPKERYTALEDVLRELGGDPRGPRGAQPSHDAGPDGVGARTSGGLPAALRRVARRL